VFSSSEERAMQFNEIENKKILIKPATSGLIERGIV
jgi:hypothetical protein